MAEYPHSVSVFSRRLISISFVLLVSTAGSGCARWFPGKVASGIARLTVRNVGAILSAVSADENCGFASQAVLDSASVEGNTGEAGQVVWTVKGCTLDFGTGVVTSTDCRGDTTTLSGLVTVDAVKIVTGRLTGSAETPVVPETFDAATINISNATFKNFLVKSSASESSLTMIKGSIAASATPGLAKSASKGVCSVAIPVVTFNKIAYGLSEVYVDSSNSFDATVQTSSYSAQSGRNGDIENRMEGTLTVWDNQETVPNDDDGLDPEYTRAKFEESYQCDEELAQPLDTECSLNRLLGEGAARLSVRTLAGIAGIVNSDTNCGFASDTALAAATTTGTTGDAGGQVTYTIDVCIIDLSVTGFTSEPDCLGVSTEVTGYIVVSGTKTVHGILTGKQDLPVVPTDWDPATLNIVASLQNVQVKDSSSDQWLSVDEGDLSGIVTPRTTIDNETGACSVSTSVAQLSDITWTEAQVAVNAGGLALGTFIEEASLYAINGRRDAEENLLSGTITIDGEAIKIENAPLNPEYAPLSFNDGLACREDITLATSSEECDFTAVLAQGVARLLVRGGGIAVKAAQRNTVCGFTAIDGLVPSDIIGASPGDEVTTAWDIENCELGGGDVEVYNDKDCNGRELYLSGNAYYYGTKKVTGLLALGYPPVQPLQRESVHFVMDQVIMKDFAIVYYPEGKDILEPLPEAYMLIRNGTMRGRVSPVMAESESIPDRYFIVVGTAEYKNISISNADVVVYIDGMQFNFLVDDAVLQAFSGAYLDRANELSGYVVIDGKRYEANADGGGLSPGFNAAAEVGSYICLDDLKEELPIDGFN